MIHLLHGTNDFLKRQRLAELVADAEVERYDGEALSVGQLQDLVRAQMLFSTEQVIVIRDLSQNTDVWAALPEVAMADDTMLILYETKPDKRTRTYKFLQKHATVEEFASFGERDTAKAVQWCVARAKQAYDFSLDLSTAQALVERAGLDMGRLDGFLEQLALLNEVDETVIATLVPLPKIESAFVLFEAVLAGKTERVSQIIHFLETESGSDGAYQTLGLLVSQLVPLNALVLGASSADVAKSLGVHPFVVQKLAPHARRLTRTDVRRMNAALADADAQMKSTSVSPWLILEAAVIGMCIRES